MARSNDSTRTNKCSHKGPRKSPSSSSWTTSSNDNALSKYRIGLFLSDKITTANAALVLRPKRNDTAEAIKVVAQKRMEAELRAFDNAFDQSTTATT